MAQRYTGGPDVVSYNSGTYDPYYGASQPHYAHQPAAYETQVAADPRYPVQPIDQTIPNPYYTGGYTSYNQSETYGRGSNAQQNAVRY